MGQPMTEDERCNHDELDTWMPEVERWRLIRWPLLLAPLAAAAWWRCG